jgi:hypothetical protein
MEISDQLFIGPHFYPVAPKMITHLLVQFPAASFIVKQAYLDPQLTVAVL